MADRKSSTDNSFQWIQHDNGFALPSVLFLLLIVSTLAFSLLSVNYIRHRIALIEQLRVKATYAAENGVAMILTGGISLENNTPLGYSSLSFDFSDGSTARVTVTPWGNFIHASSEGKSGKVAERRYALLGAFPDKTLKKALIFANTQHDLVLAGTSSIIGDITTGPDGISARNLRGYGSPSKTPVLGAIEKQSKPKLPTIKSELLRAQLSLFERLLNGDTQGKAAKVIYSVADLYSVGDSADVVLVSGKLDLRSAIRRRGPPLCIVVGGDVNFGPGAIVYGAVAILSSGTVTVSEKANLEHVLLYSRKKIVIENNAVISGQLFSHYIHIKPSTKLSYPSSLISIANQDSVSQFQQITLETGSVVQGTVLLVSNEKNPLEHNLITIDGGAQIIGTLYSTGTITLDGAVHGNVITREFYFYHEPTSYKGWLRSARIDRSRLPEGFLMPIAMSQTKQMNVLDWL